MVRSSSQKKAARTRKYDTSDSTTLATTVDQWMTALASTEDQKYPAAVTLAGLVRQLGLPRTTVRDRLLKAVKAGTCQQFRDVRRGRQVDVYIINK